RHRRGRAVRVGPLAVQPQRRARRLAGGRRRAGRHAARRVAARAGGPGGFGAAVGAGQAPARVRPRGRGCASGHRLRGAGRGRERPVQLPADRRAGDRGHGGRRHPVVPHVRACRGRGLGAGRRRTRLDRSAGRLRSDRDGATGQRGSAGRTGQSCFTCFTRPEHRGRKDRDPMTPLDRRLPPGFLEEALRADARTGLTAEPKSLPPKWFYDAQGSALFDKITELPEYYPTRAEREILRASAAGIAAQTGARTLIELGSGSSDKTRLLLDALRDAGTLRCYVPVDVSEPALAAAGKALSAEYPGLDVRAVVSDFEERLGFPADGEAPAPRLVAFLGSTIGNLEPGQRAAFLARVRA